MRKKLYCGQHLSGSAPLAFSIDPTAANHETTVTSTDVTITVISEMTTSSTDLSAGPTNRTRYGTTISPETTTMGNSVTTSLLSTSFPTTLSDTPPTTIGTTKPPSTGETPLKTSPSEGKNESVLTDQSHLQMKYLIAMSNFTIVTTTVTEKAETTSTTTSETTMLPSTVTERTTLKTSPSESKNETALPVHSHIQINHQISL